jgi:hypothetical protein
MNGKNKAPDRFQIFDYYRRLTEQLLARDTISESTFSHGTVLGNQTENIVRDFVRQVRYVPIPTLCRPTHHQSVG